MREHQIVITLKPEQFLEVQRLARAANAKSMGIFVRQQLLAALGIEGTLQGGYSNAAPDLQPILGLMKRLHGELKMFVAESLSIYDQEFEPANSLTESAEIEPAQTPNPLIPSAVPDELEQAAERAFAISPRLGSITSPTGDLEPFKEIVPPGLIRHKTEELYARKDVHQRDLHRHAHSHSTNDALDTPFLPGDQQHDLAPAIESTSPNFEADTTASPQMRDPLADLLPQNSQATYKQSLQKQSEDELDDLDDSDDLLDVPLSIIARRAEIAAQSQLADAQQSLPDIDAQTEHDSAAAIAAYEASIRAAAPTVDPTTHHALHSWSQPLANNIDKTLKAGSPSTVNEIAQPSPHDADPQLHHAMHAWSQAVNHHTDATLDSDSTSNANQAAQPSPVDVDPPVTHAMDSWDKELINQTDNHPDQDSLGAAINSDNSELPNHDDQNLNPGKPLGHSPLSGSLPPKRREV